MRGQLTRETRLTTSVKRLKTSVTKLRRENLDLYKQLKEKDKQIGILEAKLTDKEAQRKELLTYLYKPSKKDRESLPRGKKPGAPAYHRPIPKEDTITERCTYTLQKCPICTNAVGEAVDTVVKYEEDIDLKPRPIVKQYTITRHWCGHCETYVKSKNIPDTSRIGVNVLGYILYARYRLRLPMKKVRESLRDLYNFQISEGEIVAKLDEARTLFGEDYDAITLMIEEASAVYADETGWKMDGKNWWLWVFVTERGVRYVIEDTRGKGVAARALGLKEDRVIISDGYTAYKNLPGEKQQCWVHLLRVAKIHSPPLYEDLVLLYKRLLLELEKKKEERDKTTFGEALARLIAKAYPQPEATKVQARMRHHQAVLFTCLDHDGVLPENNTAQRAIRLQVVMRKIFGGSRSLDGAKAHEVNTSVIETQLRQHPDVSFFDLMLPLLKRRRSEL